MDTVETVNKWQVEMLVTLQLIDQKLGFMLQAMENIAFPVQMIDGEAIGVRTNEAVEFVDDPVTLKTLDGSDKQVAFSNILATSPKTAAAIKIARALSEPFQAYVMNPEGDIGIIVGDGTKAHIERLRSQGQWA